MRRRHPAVLPPLLHLPASSPPSIRTRPGKTAVLSDLPELLWAFSAYILNSEPRHYISRQAPDAYLAAASELESCLTTLVWHWN